MCSCSYIHTVLKLQSAFEGNHEVDVGPGENEFETPGIEKRVTQEGKYRVLGRHRMLFSEQVFWKMQICLYFCLIC